MNRLLCFDTLVFGSNLGNDTQLPNANDNLAKKFIVLKQTLFLAELLRNYWVEFTSLHVRKD